MTSNQALVHINNSSEYEVTDQYEVNREDNKTSYEQYLTWRRTNKINTDSRIALVDHLYKKQLEGNSLYHLVLTYKQFSDRDYSESDCNKFFKTFYLQKLLPYLLGTRNFTNDNKRHLQPDCYAFIDEHAHKPKIIWKRKAYGELEPRGRFAERLHHHAILAIHPDTKAAMDQMVGENTFANGGFSHKVMTSHLRECEPMCLLYASKCMDKYPDFMTFTGNNPVANKAQDNYYEQKRRAAAELSANGLINYRNATSVIDAISKFTDREAIDAKQAA
jgi:hypothetical protein